MFTVSGRITDADTGIGVENATVVIGQEFALTDQHGFYTILNVPAGTHPIYAMQRYYQKFASTLDINGNLGVNIGLHRE